MVQCALQRVPNLGLDLKVRSADIHVRSDLLMQRHIVWRVDSGQLLRIGDIKGYRLCSQQAIKGKKEIF